MAKKSANSRTTKKKDGTHRPHVSLRVAVIVVVSFVSLGLIYFGASAYLNTAYAARIFPGLSIGGVDFTGATREEAQTILQTHISAIEAGGITTAFNDSEVIIASTIAPKSEIDSAFPLYTYDTETMVERLLAHGRNKNGLVNSWNRIFTLLFPKQFVAEVDFNSAQFEEVLRTEFSEYEHPAVNADLTFADGSFSVEPSALGEVFPYTAYAQNVLAQLQRLEAPSVQLALTPDFPTVSDQLATASIPQAELVYNAAPFPLVWEDKTWEVTQDDVAQSVTATNMDGVPGVVFSEEGLSRVLDDIRTVVTIEPKNARFMIQDGKVAEFQESVVGRTVDISALLLMLNERARTLSQEPIPLSVVTLEPEISESEADDLGITELVAKATTNFAGSPTNRRKNIANGVRLINGTLIKPGETYSVVKSLSPIEIANGFFSELVIKGNRTIPEVGGGLCQVSTTLFRTALNAGLPIAERRNHSYRVSYYEPPVGMDATIYDPAPDFKFTNDYGGYLLLLGYVEGNDITFELWGTKDGRTVNTTEPRMYNITSPGPTQYIESDDLAPGEEKCIERAHNGATADFTYTVTYPSGEVKEETFVSKYKAWQAVCLVGKST